MTTCSAIPIYSTNITKSIFAFAQNRITNHMVTTCSFFNIMKTVGTLLEFVCMCKLNEISIILFFLFSTLIFLTSYIFRMIKLTFSTLISFTIRTLKSFQVNRDKSTTFTLTLVKYLIEVRRSKFSNLKFMILFY